MNKKSSYSNSKSWEETISYKNSQTCLPFPIPWGYLFSSNGTLQSALPYATQMPRKRYVRSISDRTSKLHPTCEPVPNLLPLPNLVLFIYEKCI
jgi:hypothetical protein